MLMVDHVVLGSIRMVHPRGFSVASDGVTMLQQETGASVAACPIDQPFEDVVETLTPEALKEKGMQWLGQESVTIDGVPGRLLHLSQWVAEQCFVKWVGAFGCSDRTYLVTAAYPRNADHLSAELRSVVLSATRIDQTPQTPPMSLDTVPPLAYCKEYAGQLIYTHEGRFPVASPEDPIFVVSVGQGSVGPEVREDFCRHRLGSSAQLANVVVSEQRHVMIDELDGCEMFAEGQDCETGRPLTIYQLILFLTDSYFILQGLAGAEHQEELRPVFRKMAHSFRRDRGTVS